MADSTESTKAELRELMRRHGIHAEDVATLLGRDLSHVYDWLAEERPPMPAHLLALLRDRLQDRAPPC